MFDFRGWWFNWEWDGSIYGAPSWLRALASLALGAAGAFALAACLATDPREAWLAPVGAVLGAFLTALGLVEALLLERSAAVFVVGDALALAGVAAMAARAVGGVPARAACVALASTALLWRAWGATWFAVELAADLRALDADLARARGGAEGVALVRITGRRGDVLDAVDESGGRGEPVELNASVFDARKRHLAEVDRWLVEAPRWEERPDGGADYRSMTTRRVLTGAAKVQPVYEEAVRALQVEGYRAEVRAGAVVLAALHGAVVAAGVALR